MTPTPEVQARLRQYLLGQLDDDRRGEIERDLLAKDEVFEELLAVEDEVTDDYINGRLNELDRQAFETHFLATPEHREKLGFGRAFNRHLSSQAAEETLPQPKPQPQPRAATVWHFPALFSSPLRIAAFALLTVGIALGVWRIFFHQSEVDKGLIALNAAYKEQRPVESRISALSYAPFPQTRGPNESPRVNSQLRSRAELILNSAAEDPRNAAAHHALGQVYLAAQRFDEAITHFDLALKNDPKNAKLYSDLGAAWLEKGKVDLAKESGGGMEELGRALENLSKALEFRPNLLEARFNRALCEEQLGLLLEAGGDWREYLKNDPSSQWSNEAANHLKRIEKTPIDRAQLIENFDHAYQAGNDEQAWSSFCEARARAGNQIVDDLLNRRLNATTNGQQEEAKTALAELSFAAGLEMSRTKDRFTTDLVSVYASANSSDNDRLRVARSQLQAATQIFNSGEFESAAHLYQQARESFKKAGDDAEALLAESSRGYCYLRLTYSQSNVPFFENLLRVYKARQYRSMYAQALHALSDAQWALNRFTDALASVEMGLKIAEDIQDYPTIVRCRAQIISIYRIFGDYSTSLASVARAIEVSNILPPDPKLTWQLYQQAAYDFHGMALDGASTAFELNAVQQADAAGVPLLKSRSLAQLGLLYAAQQKHGDAIRIGELARREAQYVGNENLRANIDAYSQLMLGESYLAGDSFREAGDRFQAALILYEHLKLPAYDYQAHKGKFLSFLGLRDDAAADSELTTALELFETYRKEISNESSRDQFFGANQDIYDKAVDFACTRQNDSERAFDYAESSRARSLFEMMNTGARIVDSNEQIDLALEANTHSFNLRKIQQGLTDQVQLLEYAVLDDKVVMWVVKQNSGLRTGFAGMGANEIDQRVRRFVALVSNPATDRESIRSSGRELYDILIKPVEDSLDSNRELCIVADKSLNYLPFAALVSGDGKYLVERYALMRAPSATVFVQLSEEAKRRGPGSNELLLSVGNPRFDRTRFGWLAELPTAATEARQLATYYHSPIELIGDAASADRVKKAMPRADVIHFATHAIADGRSPLLSKLLLAPDSQSNAARETDGVLQASEIYRITLPRTHLVILSACRTGIERAFGGEGPIGLARPFIAANVPLVIASLWPVDSQAASEIMIDFHRRRKEGNQPTIEALRQSQLAMIDKERSGSEPNYEWAAFTLIGGYATF